MAFDGLKNFFGLETLVEHERCAGIEGGVHDKILTEAVKKRQIANQSIVRCHLRVMPGGLDIGDDIAVGEQRALRFSRGSRRVKNCCAVIVR